MTGLNVLDLAPIPDGGTPSDALRNTVDLARRAEDWGYGRYWVAEHHFAHVASAAPAVLIGEILARTSRIRVGSAAVLIGFTTAPAVADAFGVLAALHPGRIDIGLGRTGQRLRTPPPGSPAPNPVSVAGYEQLYHPKAEPPSYTRQVEDVLDLIGGTFTADGYALRSPVAEAAAVRGIPISYRSWPTALNRREHIPSLPDRSPISPACAWGRTARASCARPHRTGSAHRCHRSAALPRGRDRW